MTKTRPSEGNRCTAQRYPPTLCRTDESTARIPIEMPELTILLFSQQTVLAEHSFPVPPATTEIGEHLRPIWAVVSCRTTPRVCSRADPAAELAYNGHAGQRGCREEMEGGERTLSMLLQHCTGPVLQC